MKAVAITQQVSVVSTYCEHRDCLDQAWTRFLLLCGLSPVRVDEIGVVRGYRAEMIDFPCLFYFTKACDEFHRILRPVGVFAALWNPRFIEANPLLVAIEAEITRLKPDIRHVSSGRSG